MKIHRSATTRFIAIAVVISLLVINYLFFTRQSTLSTESDNKSEQSIENNIPPTQEIDTTNNNSQQYSNDDDEEDFDDYQPGVDLSSYYAKLQSPPWVTDCYKKVPKFTLPSEEQEETDEALPQIGIENAVIIMLVRNSELAKALHSIRQVESTFNHRYHYPWLFMNDVPFTNEFKKNTTRAVSGTAQYSLIPGEYWDVPLNVDMDKVKEGMDFLKSKRLPYADVLSYRQMCRFNSGFFYKMESIQKYQYYWRVEPAVEFFCQLTYDPFTFLRENNKKYGFILAAYEFKPTIASLWKAVIEFSENFPNYLVANNTVDFLVNDNKLLPDFQGGKPIPNDVDYNDCHFWSNFEIGNLDFFKSKSYNDFFNFIDSKNGFFYERWGDAPIHSIALSLFLPRQEIHHFGDIGYEHSGIRHCPIDMMFHYGKNPLCHCDRAKTNDQHAFICLKRWWQIHGRSIGDF